VIASRFEQTIIRGSTVSYDFTSDSTKAYGFNMIKVSASPVRWGMIPGDANQDEFVDAIDQFIWVAQNGLDGYLSADFNGDSFVDAIDQAIWVSYNGLSSFLPCFAASDPRINPELNMQRKNPSYDAKNGNRIYHQSRRDTELNQNNGKR
jgi:hypothetical protein